MVKVPLTVVLQGEDADNHELPAYDGFTSLAGLSLTASLVTNYVSTGKIRHRGEFEGRDAVKFQVPIRGSVEYHYIIDIALNSPILTSVGALTLGLATNFIYDVLKKTISRNIGIKDIPTTDMLRKFELESKNAGDLEALAAASEPSLKQAHNIINNGATQILISGGTFNIGNFNGKTKDYITKNFNEDILLEKDFSVAAFNANSGVGRVYDFDLGRTVPVYINRSTLPSAKAAIAWGLNEYAKGTGKTISLKYRRILAIDSTPKRYIVVDAEVPKG